MDVGEWLRGLGLGQYESPFHDNEIDSTILFSLTAEDLRDLGVAIVGHRRKLLDAIAALRAEGVGQAIPTGAAGNRTDTAERRQVTVMFCDIVGSTALAARMDPEDLREVVATYHKCAAETVRRFDGFVSQYLGDGVLAYFGYPQAHEDDAERAVRAGRALIAAVAALQVRTTLQTRIGIATGLVVVGDIVDAGGSQERGIIGETPNLAARLQDIAQANTVVIAQSTRRLLGDLFEFHDLGAKDVKGITVPVRAFVVLRETLVESRYEALRSGALTSLIGREEELELLLRRWTRAINGEGQVVLLSGEAGIGKSRLTAALMEKLAGEPHTRLRYFCSPRHGDSVLYPFISQLERAAGLAHDDTSQQRLDKLDRMLAQTATSPEERALLAELLSLPNDGRYPALDFVPQKRRQRTLEALSLQMEVLTRQNPVLIVFEDAHWSDPTSFELLGRAVNRIADLRILLIVTFRPEFDPPWAGLAHVCAVTINRLAKRDVNTLIGEVLGTQSLPASIRDEIIERTDGIPLFVEEVTKAVLEAGSEGASRQISTTPSPTQAVPASLHASLMARLDRLGSAKSVAQVGAAIGREFSHALLVAVMRQPEAQLSSSLDRLIASGLLFRQGVPPHATYLFKHALVQDAAYGTLLREPRRELHARIAEIIEDQFTEIADSQPELLARHYTEAGLIEKAARLWGKAGQRLMVRSAYVEAIEQLTRALDQIAALPATPELRREQIKHQVTLITALMDVRGYAAPQTKAAVERAHLLTKQAEALGEPPEDPLLLFSVLYSSYLGSYHALNVEITCKLAEQFLTLAEKSGATFPRMVGHAMMGASLLQKGDLVQCLVHLDQSLALYDPAEHRPVATRFSIDHGVGALAKRSQAMWMLGYPDAAIVDAERALKEAREIGHAITLMYALRDTFPTHVLCGSYGKVSGQTDELVALADEKVALSWKAFSMLIQGGLFVQTGKPSAAVQRITRGATAWRSGGSTVMPIFLSYLGIAHAELRQFDDAQRCVGEAITTVEATNARLWEAEVHRMAGEIALKSPVMDSAKAEACFERAIAIAREQKAKSWELRAAMSMARFWRNQGERDQARDLLAPVYGWFTEGHDTLDLKDAKALLNELAR